MSVSPLRHDDADWAAWRPADVTARLAGLGVPWYVAAGWAIELYLGEALREHEDLEIAVPGARFGEIAAALPELEFHVVCSGDLKPLADAAGLLGSTHQTWGHDPAANEWRLDVFREPSVEGEWISRRDPSIRLPYDRLIERTPDGIPYARPEVVLLFKAKHVRPKDEVDFAAAVPRLGPARRHLLADWISRVHPGHAWLDALV